jgi:hypothetical protein
MGLLQREVLEVISQASGLSAKSQSGGGSWHHAGKGGGFTLGGLGQVPTGVLLFAIETNLFTSSWKTSFALNWGIACSMISSATAPVKSSVAGSLVSFNMSFSGIFTLFLFIFPVKSKYSYFYFCNYLHIEAWELNTFLPPFPSFSASWQSPHAKNDVHPNCGLTIDIRPQNTYNVDS